MYIPLPYIQLRLVRASLWRCQCSTKELARFVGFNDSAIESRYELIFLGNILEKSVPSSLRSESVSEGGVGKYVIAEA